MLPAKRRHDGQSHGQGRRGPAEDFERAGVTAHETAVEEQIGGQQHDPHRGQGRLGDVGDLEQQAQGEHGPQAAQGIARTGRGRARGLGQIARECGQTGGQQNFGQDVADLLEQQRRAGRRPVQDEPGPGQQADQTQFGRGVQPGKAAAQSGDGDDGHHCQHCQGHPGPDAHSLGPERVGAARHGAQHGAVGLGPVLETGFQVVPGLVREQFVGGREIVGLPGLGDFQAQGFLGLVQGGQQLAGRAEFLFQGGAHAGEGSPHAFDVAQVVADGVGDGLLGIVFQALGELLLEGVQPGGDLVEFVPAFLGGRDERLHGPSQAGEIPQHSPQFPGIAAGQADDEPQLVELAFQGRELGAELAHVFRQQLFHGLEPGRLLHHRFLVDGQEHLPILGRVGLGIGFVAVFVGRFVAGLVGSLGGWLLVGRFGSRFLGLLGRGLVRSFFGRFIGGFVGRLGRFLAGLGGRSLGRLGRVGLGLGGGGSIRRFGRFGLGGGRGRVLGGQGSRQSGQEHQGQAKQGKRTKRTHEGSPGRPAKRTAGWRSRGVEWTGRDGAGGLERNKPAGSHCSPGRVWDGGRRAWALRSGRRAAVKHGNQDLRFSMGV